jgi:DedD protein
MMERTLKERIIGAIVLVTFVVLVVPVFLDGPPEGGATVSERVLLPGQEGQDTKTVVLNRERDEPIPAANSEENANTPGKVAVSKPEEEGPVPVPVRKPAPLRAEAQSDPEPQPDVTSKAASTTGMWAVQLGSFSNKQNAEKLAADLRKQGYAAFLSQLKTSSGQLHRVRIGPQKDRESAELMASRLSKVGHEGQVVPHP